MSDTEIAPDDDLATLLAKREHARPNKATWILLTLLVLAVGFAAGAMVGQKSAPASTAMTFGGPPAGFTPPGTSTGAGPAAGVTSAPTAGSATTGTVKLVDGRTIYIATTDGAVVKVTVPASAAVTAQEDIALADIPSGAKVTVQGQTANDGTVTATEVSRQPTTQGAN